MTVAVVVSKGYQGELANCHEQLLSPPPWHLMALRYAPEAQDANSIDYFCLYTRLDGRLQWLQSAGDLAISWRMSLGT